MSRGTLLLILIIVLIVGGLVWLSRRPAEVPTHRIEKSVTLNDAAQQ